MTKKREILIAVAQKDNVNNLPPVVSIYYSERQKWVDCQHEMVPYNSYIKQVCLPDFSRYWVTLLEVEGSKPFVWYFKYERQQVHRAGEVDERVTKIAVNPFGHHSFIAIGDKYIKVWTTSEKQFKETAEAVVPQKYEKENTFTDIQFFPDSHAFVLVSSQRNIFIVDGKTVVFVKFEQSQNLVAELTTKTDVLEIDTDKANKEVEAEIEAQKNLFETYKGTNLQINFLEKDMDLIVETHKKGFVVGTQSKFGFFNLYAVTKEFEVSLIQSFSFSLRCIGINSLSICYDRSYMVLSVKVLDQNIEDQWRELQASNSPIASQKFDDDHKEERCRIELYQFSLADAHALKDPGFKPIFNNGNPMGAITDISVAVSKNLVASVGVDKYLRIWEYSIKNSSTIITHNLSADSTETTYSQLSWYFSKEVLYSVSVHPMGLQLAVGTREGVKVFYILENTIKLALEIHGKLWLSVRYANGGHFLAAGNGSNISILDPYTFQCMFTLIGHPSTVRYLKWTESDSHLLSNCNHGSSYGWSSNFEIYKNRGSKAEHAEHQRIEFILKHLTINSFVYDEEYDICCYSTSDGRVTMSTKLGCTNFMELPQIHKTEVTALCLVKNLQVLFAGTSYGSIKVYLWPVIPSYTNKEEGPEFAEFFVHSEKITSLEVTYDKRFLISSSDDGSIFFLKIFEFHNGIDFNSNIVGMSFNPIA